MKTLMVVFALHSAWFACAMDEMGNGKDHSNVSNSFTIPRESQNSEGELWYTSYVKEEKALREFLDKNEIEYDRQEGSLAHINYYNVRKWLKSKLGKEPDSNHIYAEINGIKKALATQQGKISK